MRRALSFAATMLLAGCWGNPVAQAPQCQAYVACIRGLDADAGQTTDLERFVEGGTCWNNPLFGDGCTTACTRALARLQDREGACLP
ncbi:MAG: hypothetical protein Q8S33_38575 [Myxococcales bacterium]|nr:hypothetical protein [Myxococcales bacterium]MDP3506309.1 hypothetical protein [Myxococcales bacterium]